MSDIEIESESDSSSGYDIISEHEMESDLETQIETEVVEIVKEGVVENENKNEKDEQIIILSPPTSPQTVNTITNSFPKSLMVGRSNPKYKGRKVSKLQTDNNSGNPFNFVVKSLYNETGKNDFTALYGNYSCLFCGRVFPCRARLERHTSPISIHDESLDYKCRCGFVFRTSCNLTFHLRVKSNKAKHGESRGRKYLCHRCNSSFIRVGNLAEHLKTHEPDYDRSFECETCGIKFVKLRALRMHEITHKPNSYQCRICNRNFKYHLAWKNHEEEHKRISNNGDDGEGGKGEGEREGEPNFIIRSEEMRGIYRCPICFITFSSKSDMGNHTLIHRDDSGYWCFPCAKDFHNPKSLNLHLRVHTPKEDIYF